MWPPLVGHDRPPHTPVGVSQGLLSVTTGSRCLCRAGSTDLKGEMYTEHAIYIYRVCNTTQALTITYNDKEYNCYCCLSTVHCYYARTIHRFITVSAFIL